VVELLAVVRDILGRQPELSHKKIEQPALFIAGTRDPVSRSCRACASRT
jgi:hypothetical protein